MGKGKGNVEYWAARIKPGHIIYELEGVPEALARSAMQRAAAKLPIRTSFEHRSFI